MSKKIIATGFKITNKDSRKRIRRLKKEWEQKVFIPRMFKAIKMLAKIYGKK